ncbi:hypothetical protein EV363DRAFT_1443718 [Boletus edulis]|nr:hypothetical protein EV363DRAFT_1443718 [Boletus edulis]
MDDQDGAIKLPDRNLLDLPWKEGVENLMTTSCESLWKALGHNDGTLPFFQEFTDPDAAIEPWSDQGAKWLANPKSNFIFDEAQLAPKFNKMNTTFYALQELGASLIVMMATSVMMKLQDLWILGYMMGISSFQTKD